MSEATDSAPQRVADMALPGTAEGGVASLAGAGSAPAPIQTEPLSSIVSVATQAEPPLSPLHPDGAEAVGRRGARRLSDPSRVNQGWWIVAILLPAGAVVCSVLVALGTAFSHAHRLSAAATALLDVAGLATLAHVILLRYQSRLTSGPAADPVRETLDYRQRGLKAAIMGQDGRASTSKTQVALWTGAVVWALIDMLLLARAYPSGNLFTGAVTSNWRPEYLVLLGLPITAAATAKAVVNGSNNGQGPVTAPQLAMVPGQTARVYVRYPVRPGRTGFFAGVAELITADDGTVAWADLQYVVFTLITLAYFLVQVLAQPQHGLPPVPAALLTLTGVSASGYTASKIMEVRGTTQGQAKEG